MISLLGNLILSVAFLATIIQSIAWIITLRGSLTKQNWAYGSLWFQSIAIGLSYGLLTLAFASNDFSLVYVANNSQKALPLIYRLTAVWGGHEGSLLLWVLILSGWCLAVWFKRHTFGPAIYHRSALILSILSSGFLAFILFTSNPFEHFIGFIPPDGRSLNPILQDPGLIIHPPLLYIGYVGFSVVFALALGGLAAGEIDKKWNQLIRPWVIVPWIFLTLGIGLGSWWAYRELGWGGWWFWDPVENSSFMPWLLGTGLFHALLVTERVNWLRRWAVLLTLGTFTLSILGTFLVRSGILISVHAFATDPSRGLFLLLILLAMVVTCLLMYGYNYANLSSHQQPLPLLSRANLLLLNTIFFLTLTFTVLLGTLYPLLLDVCHGDKISVGAPYFNKLFIALGIPMLMLMGFAPHCPWFSHPNLRLATQMIRLALLTLLLSLLIIFLMPFPFSWSVVLGITLASWLIVSTAQYSYRQGIKGLKWRHGGMIVAHLGVAIFVLGITFTSHYSEARDLRMSLGDQAMIGPYTVKFNQLTSRRDANYLALQGHFSVANAAGIFATLYPEKRIYSLATSPLSHAAIHANLFRDVYVVLGQPFSPKEWSIRLYYKPCVRWIWGGGLLMALGGILALLSGKPRE